MPFIDFLFANLKLNPADGDEENVYPMPAYRGPSGITAFHAFTDEEIELINKTKGCWVHVAAREWAPLSVQAMVPGFNRQLDGLQVFGHLSEIINGPEGSRKVGVISYLDLSIVYMEAPPEETLQIFRKRDEIKIGDFEVWDMTYLKPGCQDRKGDKYLFSQPLQVVGRVRELPKIQAFKPIHDFLHDDMLILAPQVEAAPRILVPQARAIKTHN